MKRSVLILSAALWLAGCASPPPAPTNAPVNRPTSVQPTLAPASATPRPAPAATPTAVDPASIPLLAQAQAANLERYQFAIEHGAQFVPTSDGRSFYLWWIPPGFDQAARRPVIVTLHGHASWALDGFYLWQPYAAQRGYAILALQWWFGGGETTADYYQPVQMYPLLTTALTDYHVQPGQAVLHGFSRGSTNTYALAALDRPHAQAFGLIISNSGGAAADYPPNAEILQGRQGPQPFQGAHWVMYCGEKDPNPERDGCPAMRAARDFVTQYGATVELLIDDPAGDHGGFHRNADNVNAALDVADRVLGK